MHLLSDVRIRGDHTLRRARGFILCNDNMQPVFGGKAHIANLGRIPEIAYFSLSRDSDEEGCGGGGNHREEQYRPAMCVSAK